MLTRVPAAAVLAFGLVVAAQPRPGFAQPKAAKPQFQPAAARYFAQWDKDKNGELSVVELDAVLTDPKVKGEAAAVAAVLRAAATPAKKADKAPVINPDFAATAPEPGKPSLDARFNAALGRIAKAERKLFVGEGPRFDALRQGGMGDCFALAPLGALLARDPAAVKKMMTEVPGGRYKVTFADKAVELAPFTDGEFAMAGGWSENTGCWVRVYEKALGQYMRDRKGEPAEKSLAADVIGHGGTPAPVIAALTGHATAPFVLGRLREPNLDAGKKAALLKELRDGLTAAVGKRLVTLGTPADGTPGVSRVPGVPAHHLYAVIGYDPKTDVLTIWNPHGNEFTPKGPDGIENGYTKKDGVFKAPLNEVAQWAGRVVSETDKPAPPPKK